MRPSTKENRLRTHFRRIALAICVALAPWAAAADDESATQATPTGEKESLVVEDGRTVAIEYTLKLDDGTTADTNVDNEPLVYEQGQRQILPALEQALSGMEVEESRELTIPAEKAYGEVDPDLFQEVDAEVVPEQARSAGTQLISEDGSGNRRIVRVHEVSDEKITLDLNHPLAGETLHFEVKVLSIE